MTLLPDNSPRALGLALHWLSVHAGFPARRLPVKMELLVLLASAATAAQQVTDAARKPAFGAPFGPSTGAHLRDYTIRRRHAHVKSDNSAKV